VPSGIARPLIEGLRNEVVVRDPRPAHAFGISPTPFELAVRRAIERVDGHDVETTWFDSLGAVGRPELGAERSREGMIVERRQRSVDAGVQRTFAQVEGLGGDHGWPYANVLWRVRGLVDRAVGGVGMRLGRRDPDHLRVGDAVDFWRVESVRRPELLRLRAEMKVPGRAWLQYEVSGDEQRSLLVQTAFFEPKGLSGLVYWYALLPLHLLVFRGTIRALARRAERAGGGREGP
jgi:hypothetical protein